MNNSRNSLSNVKSWSWWRWLLSVLNIIALILSAILTWHYISGNEMIGCSGGSPCDLVLNSQWSLLLGILPVSGLAVSVYLGMLVAGFFVRPNTEPSVRLLAWKTMLILAGSIVGSAIWFTALQKWKIGDFCPYCMSAHITGILLSLLIIWLSSKEFRNGTNNVYSTNPSEINMNNSKSNRELQILGFVLIGLFLAGTMVAVQVGYTPPSAYSGGKSKDSLPEIEYHEAPIIGSIEAPNVVTVLFDYQCSHCQKIHFILNEVVNRYKGKVAFVLCPTPLNTKCNPYIQYDSDAFKNSCELAHVGLALWRANKEKFSDFENWMFTYESGDRWHSRNLDDAKAKAIELVGKEKFDIAWSDPWIDQYIQKCVQLFGQTLQSGKGGIPKLVYGKRWVIPETNNVDEFIKILQNSLAFPKL